tara:strand:- start:3524 stop:4015 length:492 start_codon:yes stop_codon:yes gene_type:complete
MAASVAVKVKRDGTLSLADGGGNTYTVAYENGNVSFDGGAKASRVVIMDRGTIVGLRKGDDPVPTLTFDVHMRDFTDGSATALVDFLDKTGSASGNTSVGGSAYEQYMIDVTLTIEGTDLGDSADASAKANTCLATWSFAEGDPNTISVSCEVYEGFTFTGQA